MKKRWKNILSMSLCLSIVLSGCTGKNDIYDNNEDAFKDVESHEEVFNEDKLNEVESAFGWLSDEPLQLQENGNIKSQIKIQTTPNSIDMGVICFVDGYIQPMSINGNEEQAVNIVTTSDSDIYDIEFTPISYKENEDTRVDIISLLNPTLEIDKDTADEGLSFATSQPNSAIFSQTGEKSVKESITISPSLELSDELKDKWKITDTNNRFANSPLIYFDVDNEKEERKLVADNGKINTTLVVYGGNCEKYNLYVLVDNKIAKISDNEYIKVDTSLDEITKVDINIDISEITDKEYVGMYALLVPDGDYKDKGLVIKKSLLVFVDNTNN